MTNPDAAEPAALDDPDLRVLDAGALRALAHPLRVKIYDILSQHGPQTASSLAELTGESTGSTSYHLRALAKHELIREVPGRGIGRERWWERPRGGISLTNPEALTTPSGRAATQVVMNEFFALRHRQLLDFVSQRIDAMSDGHDDPALIATATARLTDEQTHQLIRRLTAVVDEYVTRFRDQRGAGVRPVTIRTDIFPLTDEADPS